MKIQSGSQHTFAKVPTVQIPRSVFNRSHNHKTTFDAGLCIPIYVDEALPGDTFKLNLTAFARLATPLFPTMDNLRADIHFFAVPLRLVWDNFQKQMGEQIDPGDSTDYLTPIITSPSGGYLEGSVYDYMGLPTKKANLVHSALFLRSHNLIYNEWYRDQNLQDSLVVNRDDGPDSPGTYELFWRNKPHDYFTSCLPFPQKGPSVTLPLGTSAPVLYEHANVNAWLVRDAATGNLDTSATAALLGNNLGKTTKTGSTDFQLDPNGNLVTDLTAATAATINELRQAFQIQRLYERDARAGTRYTEILLSHFGVQSPDSRLNRPEFLGGGSFPVLINPVPQTGATTTGFALGQLAGFGTGTGQVGFVKSFVEHSIVIGYVSVLANVSYQQGLHKMWTRRTRFDYYWPVFSHLGEQAVLMQELYAQGTSADDDVFGYQERHGEYRYKNSLVTGLFRSNATGTLDAWHYSQNLSSPALNSLFIESRPPVDRTIAVPSQPHFIFDSYFDMKCARPMPLYGVPGLIDHF